jgi:predicted kinase
MNKKVIFACGIPASGKSTWVRQESQRLSTSSTIISRDIIRRKYNETLSEIEVSKLFDKEIMLAMTNPSITYVFIDNTNLKQCYIVDIMNKCEQYNYQCDFFIKVFDTPYEECIERNSKRYGKERVSEQVMQRMKNNFDIFKHNLKRFCWDKCIDLI